jgi:dihydrofolate reductase
MRRLRYSVAMSLDGCIAGPKGEADWILMDPEIDFRQLFAQFDAMVIGRKTYEAAQKQGGGGMPGMKVYVVSTTLRAADHPKVKVVGSSVKETLTQLKREPGKDVWLMGGGALFSSLLDLGLVDTVEVAVIPVLLGGGIPLLQPIRERAELKLMNSRVLKKTGTVLLEYAVAGGR